MPFTPTTRVPSPRVVVGVAALLNLTSYVDRSCISVAAPLIGRELHLTPTQLGSIFSSFFLLYALLQAPWGVLADRLGPRRIVTIAVFGWCTFTALTGAAMNYLALLAVRFAFGGMESALGPAISSAFAAWIPEKSRAGAFGVFLAGGRIGGALAPVIAAFLVMRHGWRATFIVLALVGLAVPLLWLRAVPSHAPLSSSRFRARPAITSLLSLRFGALLLVVFGYTIMWQFFATWYPTYLVERRGFTLAVAAKYAAAPFILGIFSNWIGGWMCDALPADSACPWGVDSWDACPWRLLRRSSMQESRAPTKPPHGCLPRRRAREISSCRLHGAPRPNSEGRLPARLPV